MYKIVFWRLNSEKSELTGNEESIGNLIEMKMQSQDMIHFKETHGKSISSCVEQC